jgi:hypothetical protein
MYQRFPKSLNSCPCCTMPRSCRRRRRSVWTRTTDWCVRTTSGDGWTRIGGSGRRRSRRPVGAVSAVQGHEPHGRPVTAVPGARLVQCRERRKITAWSWATAAPSWSTCTTTSKNARGGPLVGSTHDTATGALRWSTNQKPRRKLLLLHVAMVKFVSPVVPYDDTFGQGRRHGAFVPSTYR